MSAAERHPVCQSSICCVSSRTVADRLQEHLGFHTDRCDNVFDAIASITFRTPIQHPTLIAIESDRLNSDAEDAIAALRDAAPDARIIIVGNGTSGEIHYPGADAVLPSDWTRAHARRVVLGEESIASQPTPPPPTDSVLHAAPPASGALGDIDLVEALFSDGSSVLDLALSLIEQSSSLRGVHFAQHVESLNSDSAIVAWNGRIHGHLAARNADAQSLRPWAEWLARWLSLEQRLGTLQTMAYTDDLTGAWNRRYFEEFMATTLAEARQARRQVTVMVFDIDDFKKYNDQYGHDAGDDVLREVVSLLNSVIRRGDKVCRIGGDEFVVVFSDPEGPREPGSSHPRTVGGIAQRFRAQVCNLRFPRLGLDAPGTLSISAGLATFPWDGHDSHSLLCLADQRALESKRRGKNVITFGPGAVDDCDQIDQH